MGKPQFTITVGTTSGQDFRVRSAQPEHDARDILRATSPVLLTLTNGDEALVRPERVEFVSYETTAPL
ncbi:MAG: hypothetical protein Q4G40_11975 [Brachybacterium sp.]|nr:hypothetical protein [Brachybacterium sp.]